MVGNITRMVMYFKGMPTIKTLKLLMLFATCTSSADLLKQL